MHRLGVFFISGGIMLAAGDPAARGDNVDALTSMCAVAINHPSNSVTSFERQTWARSATNSMCDTHFTNVTSFKSAGGSLGLTIPVMSSLFGLNADGNWSDQEIQNAYTNVCQHGHTIDTGDNESYLQSNEVTTAMIDGYKFCISSLATIFSSISPNGIVVKDFTMTGQYAFEFTLRDYTGAAISRIQNITGVQSCSVSDQHYVPGKIITFDPARVEMNGTCQRATPDFQGVSFDTNVGVSNRVDVPAVTNPIDVLSNRLDDLQRQIGALAKKTDIGALAKGTDIGSLQSQINTLAEGASAMQPLMFGGIFARQDPGKCPVDDSQKNPLTQDYTCEKGFDEMRAGRFRGSESNCGVDLMVCIKKKGP